MEQINLDSTKELYFLNKSWNYLLYVVQHFVYNFILNLLKPINHLSNNVGVEDINIDMKSQKITLKAPSVDAKKLFEFAKKNSGGKITSLIFPDPKDLEKKKEEQKKEKNNKKIKEKIKKKKKEEGEKAKS